MPPKYHVRVLSELMAVRLHSLDCSLTEINGMSCKKKRKERKMGQKILQLKI